MKEQKMLLSCPRCEFFTNNEQEFTEHLQINHLENDESNFDPNDFAEDVDDENPIHIDSMLDIEIEENEDNNFENQQQYL